MGLTGGRPSARRHSARAVCAVLAALFLVAAGGVSAASAASPVLLVSRDGISYAPTLSGGIFDGVGQLVPGQSVSRDLWIQNPTGSSAALRVSVRDFVATSTAFANGVTLTVVDSVSGTPPFSRTLASLANCDVLSSIPALAPGSATLLTLTLKMGDLTEAVAQSDSASLDLFAAMRDGVTGPFAASACDDAGTLLASTGDFRTVAFTGGTIPVPLVVGGGLLIGVGIFLVLARRRRQSDGD
jgi:hypothetical protein